MRQLFGTDGIRGIAGEPPLDARTAHALGVALGTWAQKSAPRGKDSAEVLIGMDTRESGPWLAEQVAGGLARQGIKARFAGVITTPGIAYLTRTGPFIAGVMISASHNPYDDNGIKLFGPDGYKLSDEVEQKIEDLIDADMGKRLAKSGELGRAKRIDGVHDRYIEFAKRTMPRNLSLDGLRVVIDCANGAAYRVAPEALWELGADVVPIGVDPDGFNINRECGSTAPDRLCRKVREMRADVGVALDGDADRVVIADEHGHLIDGDQLLAVIAESWAEERLLTKPGIVGTVMTNLGLERHLASLKLSLVRTPVGDRYVLEHMREHGYNVGGEQSGHIILSNYTTTGDGFIAALQMLAVVKKKGKPVSEVCHRFEPLPQVLRNVRYRSGKPLELTQVRSAIAEGESKLNGHGRLVIRPSGTEPVIRIMGEGDDKAMVEEIVDGIAEVLAEHAA